MRGLGSGPRWPLAMGGQMQSDYEAKLLIVEGEGDSLSMLSTILGRIFPKITLYTARDGMEVLNIFKEHEPDIVLTGLGLPKMNGGELAEKIRAVKPAAKIIVITGESERKQVEAARGRELAADHFLVKPVDLRELRNLITC